MDGAESTAETKPRAKSENNIFSELCPTFSNYSSRLVASGNVRVPRASEPLYTRVTTNDSLARMQANAFDNPKILICCQTLLVHKSTAFSGPLKSAWPMTKKKLTRSSTPFCCFIIFLIKSLGQFGTRVLHIDC